MIRVWVDAAQEDARLRSAVGIVAGLGASADGAVSLAERGFGDVDAEAVVMVALLGAFGAQPRGAATVDAAAHIIGASDCSASLSTAAFRPGVLDGAIDDDSSAGQRAFLSSCTTSPRIVSI